jgi:hypothetical protein
VKFRQRPIIVDAERFDGKALLPGMSEKEVFHVLGYGSKKKGFQTEYAFLVVEKGDWVVTGADGGKRVYGPQEFDAVYQTHAPLDDKNLEG